MSSTKSLLMRGPYEVLAPQPSHPKVSHSPELPRPVSMTRIKGVTKKDAGLLTKALYWFARREFGAVPEPVTVMAHHPKLLIASGRHELAVKKAVHGPLFELCVYRTAVKLGCSDRKSVV